MLEFLGASGAERLISWIIFSVFVALVPLAFNAASLHTRQGPTQPRTILDRGELLLITAALCAAAIGELFASPQVDGIVRLSKLIAGGAVVLILLFSSLYFADVSSAHASGVNLNLGIIRKFSIGLFAAAFLAGGAGGGLSAPRRRRAPVSRKTA